MDPPSRQTHFIVNEKAGSIGDPDEIERVIRRHFPRACFLHSQTPDQLAEYFQAQTTPSEDTYVVSVGGDGSVHTVLNQIPQLERTVLGVLSMGTGNDVARSTGHPWNKLEDCLNSLKSSIPTPVDVGFANQRRFLTSCGIGVPAQVAAMSGSSGLGRFSFGYGAWRLLGAPKPFDVTIGWDEGELQTSSIALMVANMSSTGGGLTFSPRASYEDGILDLLVVGAVDRWTFTRYLPHLLARRQIRDPRVTHLRSKAYRIRTAGVVPASCDGESVGTCPIDLRCEHRVLRMLVPVQ